jgi:hypothetical protein
MCGVHVEARVENCLHVGVPTPLCHPRRAKPSERLYFCGCHSFQRLANAVLSSRCVLDGIAVGRELGFFDRHFFRSGTAT